MAKKTYILDTNIYLTNFSAIYSFKNNDILIPFKVLDEIDKHKKRQDLVGKNARSIIRILDGLRAKGSLQKGIRLGKGYGIVKVSNLDKTSDFVRGFNLDWSDSDNIIIGTTIVEAALNSGRKHILVTQDINMRVKCDSLGIPCEGYTTSQVVDNVREVYSGVTSHLVDDQLIDRFYEGGEVFIEEGKGKFFSNQFIMLVSSSNEKKTALARFVNHSTPLRRIINVRGGEAWGVKPRNKGQNFAIDLLLDNDIKIVSLVGKAGTGKTLCAVAAGLQQVVEGKHGESTYKRLIVSRPVQPLGKDIGFLPGTIDEKMSPWLAPIQDNLRSLLGNDNVTIKMYQEQGIIEIEALTYIRGRSISDSFIIIDEAQNLTARELKTIITRVGDNTKIVLTGDIEQIDNIYVDETSNGLTYAIEKFKPHDICGHVTLEKGERSQVATLAAKIL